MSGRFVMIVDGIEHELRPLMEPERRLSDDQKRKIIQRWLQQHAGDVTLEMKLKPAGSGEAAS